MFYSSGFGWIVSDRIQGDYKLLGFVQGTPSTNCPDNNNDTNNNIIGILAWLVRTGPDANSDNQVDAGITVSSV